MNNLLVELGNLNAKADLIVRISKNRYEIIDMIIKTRKEKNLSQEALARIVGVKQEAIARIESMKVCPKLDTVIMLLQAMNYSLEIKVCDAPITMKTILIDKNLNYKEKNANTNTRFLTNNKVACTTCV